MRLSRCAGGQKSQASPAAALPQWQPQQWCRWSLLACLTTGYLSDHWLDGSVQTDLMVLEQPESAALIYFAKKMKSAVFYFPAQANLTSVITQFNDFGYYNCSYD